MAEQKMPHLPMKSGMEHLRSGAKPAPAKQQAKRRTAKPSRTSESKVAPAVRPLSTKINQSNTQPRDAQGRFTSYGARVGAWLDRKLHRRPARTLAPPKVNKSVEVKTITLTHERPLQPAKKPVKKRKPMAERGFWGKVWGLINGDARREMHATNAANTRARRKAWGIEPPKRRRKRRAK